MTIQRYGLPRYKGHQNNMYYTYILYSLKDKKLYTGFTSDLKKRIKEHNNGKNFSTKSRIPLELIYYEASTFEKDCRNREKYLKTGPGKRFLKNRLKCFFKSSLVTGFAQLTGSPQ
jgi:putative endonuclease